MVKHDFRNTSEASEMFTQIVMHREKCVKFWPNPQLFIFILAVGANDTTCNFGLFIYFPEFSSKFCIRNQLKFKCHFHWFQSVFFWSWSNTWNWYIYSFPSVKPMEISNNLDLVSWPKCYNPMRFDWLTVSCQRHDITLIWSIVSNEVCMK